MKMKGVALTIAGSDPSGGAGIQADLKTFHQFGVYGEAAITLLTVQNTRGVYRVELVTPELVREQVERVMEDIPPGAAKTGALGSAEIVEAVAYRAAGFDFPLVVDPVMISKHGAPLMNEAARRALRVCLLPQARLVTPNLHEAMALSGMAIESVAQMREAAVRIAEFGARAVLVKGGHLGGDPVDVLWDGVAFHEFTGERVETVHTHGTGCSYSAAITALLAQGVGLVEAVGRAKGWIQRAIKGNPGVGGGQGPVDHFGGPEG